MNKLRKCTAVLIPFVAILFLFSSCDEFLNPDQELKITEDKLFDDDYEYRAVEMGMYALQQDLIEQLVVLGELRGDMLTITPNADADLVEIYNFNFSENNKYASPTNFFKLISASNNLIRVLEREHPEVLDPGAAVTNFDRLYGEALCMRAWAYFNAVRIYGKVPYIEESLVTMEEIENFVNSGEIYVDSVSIDFGLDGYFQNDTTYNVTDTLQKRLYDMNQVIEVFTEQLENIKAVGVNHYINNNETDWEIVIWNTWAWHALLGQMYLYQGDLAKGTYHFEKIIYGSTEENRYQCTNATGGGNWINNLTTINNLEHILLVWFNKENFQKNGLQELFSPIAPSKYMLKPTKQAVMKWETEWSGYSVNTDKGLDNAVLQNGNRGVPNDMRGVGSYVYAKVTGNTAEALTTSEVTEMLLYKAEGDERTVNTIMEGYDTIVSKYIINKGRWDEDANFVIYRAGGIHLYLAEIYTYMVYARDDGTFTSNTTNALNILNSGKNYSDSNSRIQRGVRGRVGASPVELYNIIFKHDPFTNKVLGYYDYTGNLAAKKRYLDKKILEERGRELAFEGERFYDLMRVAKRLNDPSILADKVAAKYPSDKREQIRTFLMDENNWYIHFFD